VSEPGPRLAPLPRDRWDDDVRNALRAGLPPDALDRFFSTGPDAIRVPNALATLVHHPALARRWLAYNGVLLYDPALDPRLRELMILRVAWRTRAPYEWVQHVRLAERAGITPDEIDAIALGADADAWSPLEAALLRATDDLLDDWRVHDTTWSLLAGELDERELVEMVFVVGTYACLAMAFNSFGIELDPELSDVPAPPLPRDAGR
jgi:4-carboxymuconolactone decarboxylase